MIKRVEHMGKELAIIIENNFHEEGIHFLTPGNYSQQLAYMNHSAGKKIAAHIHNEVHRSIRITQEVLVIKSGKLRVDFYDDDKQYIESHIIGTGDIILLVAGGHGFEVIEDLEMIEVKQGPFAGDGDKVRFDSVKESKIIYKKD